MLKRILFIWLVAVSTCSFAGEVRQDSSYVNLRAFDANAMNRFKKDPQFSYEQKAEPLQSLWDRFWAWFWSKIDQLFSAENRTPVNTIIILLLVAVIVFFVIKLTRNRSAVFGGRGGKGLPYQVSMEDIHSISFEDAIREALNNGNYRFAVRLLYLQSLKLLSDRGLIDWKPGKTNQEYVHETIPHPSHDSFLELTAAFEYAWYGGENVTREDYAGIEDAFHNFQKQVAI
ncbi:MAG TPA: DUF4129 domain-containing protein [Chitinophagaceae bacterium]